jgi:hypothetical protein
MNCIAGWPSGRSIDSQDTLAFRWSSRRVSDVADEPQFTLTAIDDTEILLAEIARIPSPLGRT